MKSLIIAGIFIFFIIAWLIFIIKSPDTDPSVKSDNIFAAIIIIAMTISSLIEDKKK